MFESLSESLKLWNKNNDDRAKLQHAFLFLTIALVVLAGLIGLLNIELGQNILGLALVAGGVYLINAVAWALLQSFVLTHISSNRRNSPSSSRTSKK